MYTCTQETRCVVHDSCHPSRLCSALDSPPCCGVSNLTKLSHLEPHPPHVNFIIVRAALTCIADLFEDGKKSRKYGNDGVCVYALFHCSQNGWFFIGGLYSGAENSTITNVYWLNNFNDILRSYGKPLQCSTYNDCELSN